MLGSFLTSAGMAMAQPAALQPLGISNIVTRNYRPNQVVVKFSNSPSLNVRHFANGKYRTTSLSEVDRVLQSIGVDEMQQLMPYTGSQVSRRKARAYNGQEVRDTDLSQLYLVTLRSDANSNLDAVISQLQNLDDVEYAEPNYIVYTQQSTDYVTDPMYGQQTYLSQINMPQLWQTATNNVLGHRPVIAILDTGVDITHPDLAANIWTNAAESVGDDGIDDDGNGYKDDVHGWDFVNQTGRIGDWNGHGTHCAGIAAAVGGNGIGIAGANPEALIMPVTVMQSDGTGDVATIVKGIDYAVANGADIISMSIGAYAHSIAEEQALAKAYSKCVLVAAAGNDGRCITTEHPHIPSPAPCFPAAFNFVLGVQATVGASVLASFSNYDDDGPVYSWYSEEKLYNYELRAPGVDILSTYPGGRYKKMNGTSMACPLVAGAISRLLQTKEVLSKEMLFGDLINTSKNVIDIFAAYQLSDADRQPSLSILGNSIDDSAGDNDGRADAGETLMIYPTLRNAWGQATNIRLSVEVAENEDPTLVELITPQTDFGSELSSYAMMQSLNPLVIRLADNVVDGRHVRLLLKATCDNNSEVCEQEIVLNVENGVELGGTQRENLTLYPNVHYIVTRNWGIPRDVQVRVMPGTTIKIKDGVGISNYGVITFEGKADSMIVVTKADNDMGYIGGFLNDNANYINFSYVVFDNLHGITFDGHRYEHCVISNCEINSPYMSMGGNFRDCDIYYNKLSCPNARCFFSSAASFIETSIHDNEITSPLGGGLGSTNRFYHSNYIGNTINNTTDNVVYTPSVAQLEESNCYGNFYDTKELRGYYSIIHNTTEPEIAYLSECYLGTSSDRVAYESILDEVDNVGWGHVDVWKMARSAFMSAPGCVDCILVDDYDPQDQADVMPPIGVGRHKVEVIFNRAMNQSVEPVISMGVRAPYTQHLIAEDGTWFDPYTYVAYFTIDGKSATDGLNRIRVSGYRQKNQLPYFAMPDEYYRYNINVQAAGSMSTGLMAMPGLGKVTLTWETMEDDFDDIMGYQIYRFTRNSEGETSDSIMINNEMIDSESDTYIDYDVVPGTTYYYYIKEIGTDLTQHDASSVVAATPQTAQRGDANGSMTVDVADVLAEIAYMSNEHPEPFIFEAADVNGDNEIDILDVVGTLRIITAAENSVQSVEDEAVAYCHVEDGRLYVSTPVALGGIQVRLQAERSESLTMGKVLAGMEQLSAQLNDHERIVLAYSMSGAVIPAGEFELIAASEMLDVKDIVLSTPRGTNVRVEMDQTTGLTTRNAENTRMQRGIFDLTGRRLMSRPQSGVVIVNGKKLIL